MLYKRHPSHWQPLPLSSLANISYGPKGSIDKGLKEGVPLISTGNVTLNGQLDLNPHFYTLSENVPPNLYLMPGDLLFNWRNGSKHHLGKTALFSESGLWTFVHFLLRIRTGPRLDSQFLNQQLRFMKETGQLLNVRENSNHTFNKEALSQLVIPIPPMEEQRDIARVFKTLEEGVNQLGDLIQRVQACKQSLIRHFYDHGHRYPGFSTKKRRVSLESIATLIRKAYHPANNPEIPFIGYEHLEKETGRFLGFGSTRGQKHKKWLFESGDVLFGGLRPASKKIYLADAPGACSPEFMVLRPHLTDCDAHFLCGLIQSSLFLEEAQRTCVSAIPRAKWDLLRKLKVTIPSLREQKAIGSALEVMTQRNQELHARLEGLQTLSARLRVALLTGEKLIKGARST